MRRGGAAVIRQAPREAWPPEAFPPPDPWPQWSRVCMVAFYDLSTERSYSTGFGVSIGPIPWTPIDAWGRAHGLAGDVLRAFVAVIRRMDAAWLPIEAARLQREAKEGQP
jgi:hypothetical protein